MTEFTRADAKTVRERIEKALAAEFADDGYIIDFGNTTYGDKLSYKVNVKSADSDRAEFDLHAWGLNVEGAFGQTFTERGTEYTVTGVAPKSWKRPILCTRADDGKVYKFPADAVRKALGLKSNVDGSRLTEVSVADAFANVNH